MHVYYRNRLPQNLGVLCDGMCRYPCFMRCFAEFERRTRMSRPHKVLGEGYISEGTKEGHAVGKRAMRMILTC
jgi:hypothetical protein